MTQEQKKPIMNQNGVMANKRPDPEVVPKAKRRNFTANYKQRVLEEADKCRKQSGRVGALLRREVLYSSHLTTWRRQQKTGLLARLAPQKGGRKVDETAAENSRLRQANKRLERQLVQAELIIDAKKTLGNLGSDAGAGERREQMRSAVNDLSQHIGTNRACILLAYSRSSYYRQQRPFPSEL